MADVQVLPRPAESLQNDAGCSRKLEHTETNELERWFQSLKVSSLTLDSPWQKGKRAEPSV